MHSDRLTENLLRAFWWAQVEAHGRHHRYCGVAHLLCGIAQSRERITSEVLNRAGITVQALQSFIDPTAEEPPTTEDYIPLTPSVQETLDLALEVADGLSNQEVDCGHLLYALLNEPIVEDLREILQSLNVNPEQLRSELFVRLRESAV